MPLTTFAERMKQARTAAGMKQNELAKAVGVTPATISAYEKASTEGTGKNPTLENAQKIARILGVSLDWICGNGQSTPDDVTDFSMQDYLKSVAIVLYEMSVETEYKKEDKQAVENAPSILDYLDEESQAHFDAVRAMLDGLGIDYVIDTNMVRGLDYYNHTIFEFVTEVDGNELTVCAGGRYDGLVEYFGGPATPGFGFGMGLERLLLILDKQGVELPVETSLDVYIAVLGLEAEVVALELVQALRRQGFIAERDYLGRKLKAQFKSADVFGAKTIIALGGSEVESGQITVKNNQTRQEVTTSIEEVKNDFQTILNQL